MKVRKMLTMVLKIIGLLILLLLVIVIILGLIKGRGKAIKLVDAQGNNYTNGISVREKITINDSEQYVFIAGENKKNPVLLFLHGGPGSPEVGMHEFKAGERLEERFTVCYWEQRGAGLSYNAHLSPEETTIDVMVNDTIAVTEYLMQRFDTDQIYIMGHSWGSFLGIKTIQKKPEYYKAYFGIGQVSNQKESEKRAYDYMIDHAQTIGDKKALRELGKVDSNASEFPTANYMLSARTKYMNKYGIGIEHQENFNMGSMLKDVFLFRGYSLSDFIKFGLGSLSSIKNASHIFLNENLMETSTKFDVPIYVLHGKYDYQVSHELAQEYLNLIVAPDKAFYSFENSAHSPNFEEPEQFLNIVFSILDQYEYPHEYQYNCQ